MDRSEPTNWPGRGAETAEAPQAAKPPVGPPAEKTTRATEVPAGLRRRGIASPHPPSFSTPPSLARHLLLVVVYVAAGVAATWPTATYLTGHQLPAVRDVSGYVWDLWWTSHQVVHLGNPFFTHLMAAPVGTQLGFDTTMPLAGLIMTPITLAFGPVAAYSLLTIVLPGLLCYVMYRAARLWLAAPGAIAAGALFGLSSMMAWQDWYHLNIALGTLFLPMTLEAAVRLRRRQADDMGAPGLRQGVILGLVLGASVLVNQESAVMAVLLAAAVLLPWL
ncbi:MAG TPA: hypothetical protein VH307_28980, partial [Streptosporangiaceae bacterium]|nr:hypothetical protein [Streptosporangiaceae bacterium]